MKKFTCSICGTIHDDLTSYMNCVSKCGEKVLKEKEEEKAKKRAEEVNAAINKIKQVKVQYDLLLAKFKDYYPEEYEINFGVATQDNSPCNDCDQDCPCDGDKCLCRIEHGCKGGECDNTHSMEFYYTDGEKDKPKLSARVNGIKVDDDSIEKLFEDPEVNHLARLIGIL